MLTFRALAVEGAAVVSASVAPALAWAYECELPLVLPTDASKFA